MYVDDMSASVHDPIKSWSFFWNYPSYTKIGKGYDPLWRQDKLMACYDLPSNKNMFICIWYFFIRYFQHYDV